MAWVPHVLTPHDLQQRGPTNRQLDFIAMKYGTSPREIVRENHVDWASNAINEWIFEAGGKQLKTGTWVFEPGNKIMLPDKAVIPEGAPEPGVPVRKPAVASQVNILGVPWWGWAVLGGAGFLWMRSRRKKPKSS